MSGRVRVAAASIIPPNKVTVAAGAHCSLGHQSSGCCRIAAAALLHVAWLLLLWLLLPLIIIWVYDPTSP